LTAALLYNFTYNVNSYYSKLTRVFDASSSSSTAASGAGSIVIKRDYRLLAQDITPPGGPGLRCRLTMDNMGHLSMFTATANNVSTKFEYLGNSGLLTSREDTKTGRIFRYEYDRTGRISTIVNPTGSRTNFETDVDQSGAVVRVTDGSSKGRDGSTALATNGNVLTLVHGKYSLIFKDVV
jgi:YD repeat-containing protein